MFGSLGRKAAKTPEGRTAGYQQEENRTGPARMGFARILLGLALVVILALVLSLAACGGPDNGPGASGADDSGPVISEPAGSEPDASEPADPEPVDPEPDVSTPGGTELLPGRILIAYFSRAGENYGVGVVSKGNTAIVAELTGGDLFEIEPVTPYPSGYEETRVISMQELAENARPPIANTVDNMEEYDIVFMGYPIWCVDLPMIVYNFLESYDFSGKTVIPFNTHGGSGQAGTQNIIETKFPDSTVLGGLAIPGADAQNAPDEVRELVVGWLEGLGIPLIELS